MVKEKQSEMTIKHVEQWGLFHIIKSIFNVNHRYYRIEFETDDKGNTTYMPQVKKGMFGGWYGIIPHACDYFDITNYKEIKQFDTIRGGVCFKDIEVAYYFIDGYKVEKEKVKQKKTYKYRSIEILKYN